MVSLMDELREYLEYRDYDRKGGFDVIAVKCSFCEGSISEQVSLEGHLRRDCPNTPIKQ